MTGSSTSAAAGARCRLHAAEHYGVAGHRRDHRARSRRRSSTRGSPSGACRTGSRSGCRTTATSPDGAASTPVASIEMGEHVGEQNYPRYAERASTAAPARRPGAGPADVAHRPRPRRRPVHRGVHRPRHAHAPGRRDRRADRARPASRCATCTRCASTTCGPSTRWYRTLRGQLGPGRRDGRRGGRPRVAALPRRRRAGLRGGPDGRRPDPRWSGRRRRAHGLPAASRRLVRRSARPGGRRRSRSSSLMAVTALAGPAHRARTRSSTSPGASASSRSPSVAACVGDGRRHRGAGCCWCCRWCGALRLACAHPPPPRARRGPALRGRSKQHGKPGFVRARGSTSPRAS